MVRTKAEPRVGQVVGLMVVGVCLGRGYALSMGRRKIKEDTHLTVEAGKGKYLEDKKGSLLLLAPALKREPGESGKVINNDPRDPTGRGVSILLEVTCLLRETATSRLEAIA